MSGWIGFNTAVSGLLTSQKKLYITNHNVANADTVGYSRQQATQVATLPHRLPGIGFLGTGTNITSVNRVRDSYLDFKYRKENAPLGEWEIKTTSLLDIENILKETEHEGLSKCVDEFFKAIEDLSKDPSNESYRVVLRERAIALTSHLNETAGKLFNLQKDANYQVGANIKQINDLGSNIRRLNEQIYKLELDGKPANDLRDQRDLLVNDLSKIVDIQVNEHDGKYKVSIGGISLVEHTELSKLKYPPNTVPSSINPTEELVQVQWENGSNVFIKGGKLKALIDVRDGKGINGEYAGVPYYVKRLDEFAKIFVNEINEEHKNGYGIGIGNTGKNFFYQPDPSYEITAANIRVDDEILANIDNIAASFIEDAVENNENLMKLLEKRESIDFFQDGTFAKGTPEDYITSIITTLAVDSQYAQRMKSNQKVILDSVQTRIDSNSGVNLDEEMADMVQFMKTYSASAKMISTFDLILDTTVNKLGLVGR